MDRADQARKLLVEIRAWADDATLAQLVEAWVDVYAREARKFQDAYYIFEELASSKVATPSLLNGQAVCRMQGSSKLD
jgi:coatomer protein complex subunit epsilon